MINQQKTRALLAEDDKEGCSILHVLFLVLLSNKEEAL